jgi:hypothetical protein
VSAFPAPSRIPVIGPKILLVISVLAIVFMCLGNLRGIREAPRHPLHRRIPNRAGPGSWAGVRARPGRAGHVLLPPGRDRRYLVHRRQHQLHRIPVLASFVAEDSFLPRWLTRRGHQPPLTLVD